MAYSKEKQKQYQIDHKEELRLYNKQYRDNHPGMYRAGALKRKYNITLDDYNNLFILQEGRCAICGVHQSECSKTFSVDHNHKTETIRGLLCMNCNLILGHADDDIDILNKSIDYLRGINEKQLYEKDSSTVASTIINRFIYNTDNTEDMSDNREATRN